MASSAFDISDYLRAKRRFVDSCLDRFLPPATTPPELIHETMRYSVFAGGKRIRPILALSTAEALGGEMDPVLNLACALEMIHTYSLIHDDLPAMDDDDYRRGRLTAHKKFGEGIAILAGNGLMAHAFRLLTEMKPPVTAGQKIDLIQRLCDAVGTEKGIIAGQVMDLTTQGRAFSEDQLSQIHASKTGALIETSVTSAAVLSGAEDTLLARMSRFGKRIGLAFQIVDDILDRVASSEELGKATGKDAHGSKATYPALFGLEESRRQAADLVEQAIHELEPLGEPAFVLRELARFISVRRF